MCCEPDKTEHFPKQNKVSSPEEDRCKQVSLYMYNQWNNKEYVVSIHDPKSDHAHTKTSEVQCINQNKCID